MQSVSVFIFFLNKIASKKRLVTVMCVWDALILSN